MPRVLVADDNEDMLDTLERIFKFYQFDVEKASNGVEAIEIAQNSRPDLILLDGMMPVMDGFEACKVLKSSMNTKDIPIVFLTANYTDVKDRITGFELGADDYLLKPFNSKELVARVNAILNRNKMLYVLRSENEQLTYNNKIMQKELESFLSRSKQIDKHTLIDPLTGLYTFSFFERRLKEEFLRAIRYKTAISLVIVSINNVKKMNETLGYQVSNYIRIKMANLILNKTRAVDILSQNTEEYFYIILPQTDDQGGFLEAERLRETLAGACYFDDEFIATVSNSKKKIVEQSKITVNLGVASFPMNNIEVADENDLLNKAKEALGASKEIGLNKTVSYWELIQA
ncbi:MAG: response regulator [Calditrichaceae bacterium]